MWRTRSSVGCGRGASPCRTVSSRAPATSSPRIWDTRSRGMSSGVRRKCAASGRRTARCAQRWRWRGAPSRPRISSPWPPLRRPRPRGTRLPPHVVGIIGAGRAGVGLALALARAGEAKAGRGRYDVRLYGRSKKPVPKPLKLTVGPENEPPAWIAQAGVVILAVRDVGLRPFHIPSKAKQIYHASAVFASNYFVVVEAVAQRLLRHAGLSDAEAWQALRPLVEGTLENMSRQEPMAALTGPVARGDQATIRRHLEALTHDDAVLYRALGRAALELAQKRGMDPATAAQVAVALETDLPPVIRKA